MTEKEEKDEQKKPEEEKKKPEETTKQDTGLEARISRLEELIANLGKQEKKPEEDKKPAEVEKQDDKGGDLGTTKINPDPAGGEVKLPKTTQDKIDEGGVKEKTDEVALVEKVAKAAAELIKKGDNFTKTTTPRAPVGGESKSKSPAWDIIQKGRSGKKVDMNQIRKMQADNVREKNEQVLGKIFG